MLEDKLQALRKSFLFSDIDPQSLPKISRISYLKRFHRNELIFQEGELASGFFIVAKGMVKIYKLSFSGGEHILHFIGEGGLFAEAVVFGRLTHYPAFAEAMQETEVFYIPKKDFLSLMKSDFSLTLSVLSSMSEKLKYFNALIEELSLKSADARVAKYLLDFSFKKKSDSFVLDVQKLELAKKLGMAAETLSRIFRRLKNEHILRLNKNQVVLLNKEKLQVISSGEKA